MTELSVVQPTLNDSEDEGCVEVTIPSIDVAFGMPHELLDDMETWVHEFTESTVSDILNANGYSQDTISKIIGHAEAVDLYYHGVKYWCPIDHVLTSLVIPGNLLIGTKTVRMSTDSLWRLLRRQRNRQEAEKS